ncbi:unnamed protein product [Anisakis simplex]|uniref:Uncharacterized protein n=1 Tax=Anisakis simplex TaxID=6269 RepID=A0A3P6NLU5_ANISI|nr:unnamed protein product [Anisakis simplex]
MFPIVDTESTTKKSSTASVTNEHVRKVIVSGPRLSSGKGEMYKKMHKLLSKSLPRGGVIPQKQTKLPTKRKKDESPINAKKLTKLDAEGVDRKAHQPKITTATAASSVKSVSQKKTAAPSTTILLSQPISRQPIRSHPQLNRTKNKSNEAMTESLVMHLLDEMVVARSTLAVIVKRFREAPISQLSSDRIVACIIKLLNTMDVGNMWPTMLTASKHGVVEQVASLKERNLFELINQICAEPQWSDVCQKLFMKLAVSIQRAESASVCQLGRDIRCLLIAARIASEEDCSSSTPDGDISAVLCGVLRHLILLLSADWIVPVLCYALAISPELIKEFLIGKEDSLLPIRTLIAVHLSDRVNCFLVLFL